MGLSHWGAGSPQKFVGQRGLFNYIRGPEGEPAMPATQLGDLAGGSFMAVIGILAALVARAQTCEGRMIDVSMTEGVMSLLPLNASAYLNTGEARQAGRSALDAVLPCYNSYD